MEDCRPVGAPAQRRTRVGDLAEDRVSWLVVVLGLEGVEQRVEEKEGETEKKRRESRFIKADEEDTAKQARGTSNQRRTAQTAPHNASGHCVTPLLP